MSTLDTVFFAVLVVALLLETVWRLSTEAAPGAPPTLWLMHPAVLALPLALGAWGIERHPVAFVCAALLVHRGWAAVLRVAPDRGEGPPIAPGRPPSNRDF